MVHQLYFNIKIPRIKSPPRSTAPTPIHPPPSLAGVLSEPPIRSPNLSPQQPGQPNQNPDHSASTHRPSSPATSEPSVLQPLKLFVLLPQGQALSVHLKPLRGLLTPPISSPLCSLARSESFHHCAGTSPALPQPGTAVPFT